MTTIRSRTSALRTVVTSRTSRQSLLHVSAQVVSAALGFATTVLLARVLGVEGFGTYAVLLGYFTFSSVFFDFGIPVATKRLLAVGEASDGGRALLGAGYIGARASGVVYVVLIYASLPLVARWVHGAAADLLLVAAPLAIAFPLQEMTLSAGQGLNRIGVSAAMLVVPRAISLVALVVLWQADLLTPLAAGLSYPAGILVGVLVLVPVLRPARTRLRAALAALRAEVRVFGRHTYVGRVFDGLTNGFDRMLIAAHAGAASAGMYSIAATMSQPLGMVSRATSASAYRTMATAPAMPRRLLRVNIVWALGGGIALVALCMVLIPIAFTAKYDAALGLLPLVAAGIAIASVNEPFHAYFSSHGAGRTLRTLSVATSSLNVVLMLVLIPTLGATGAALALIASGTLNLVMNLRAYARRSA
jgi:O-antigen/teichoic acid export membrane protein